MLDDPGPWRLAIGVVDGSIALEIRLVEQLRLEAHRTVLERAELVAEVRVNRTGVHHLLRERVILRLLREVIHAKLDLDAIQHIRHHLRIAPDRNALVESVKIIVVEGEAHRQALDDEGRELRARTAPLLLGITLDELLVNVNADQRNRLLLEVLGLKRRIRREPALRLLPRDVIPLLLVDLRRGLLRRHHTPHTIKGVHVERQRIQLAVVVRHRRVREAVEGRELLHVVPDLRVVRVEDVCAILMHMDALHVLRIDITGDVRPPIDHQHRLPRLPRLMRKHRAVQAGTHYQIIIFRHITLSFR